MSDWQEYYDFYGRNSLRDDVIVKVDDDIVFVDTSRFSVFVDTVRQFVIDVFIWSANVINDGKAAVLHNLHGDLPSSVANVTVYDELVGYGNGKLHTSSAKGLAIHKHFLANSQAYFDMGLTEKNTTVVLLVRRYGPSDEHSITYKAS